MPFCKLMRVTAAAFALTLALALPTPSSAASPDNDHAVTHLPGLHKRDAPFNHYAGQLPLETGEKLFYWYTESRESPETAPVVLWLNGGPGCSSLGGFFTENGPFVVDSDLKLRANPYSWNRKANVVWLESPAGVGFSGPVQPASYYTDDTTAAKTREFLGLFFDKYSELRGRPLFITGESYAGFYIPYLVDLLVREPLVDVNLAGFAIGNAYTDPHIDGNALFDYYVSHALISPSIYNAVQEACDGELGWVYSGKNHSQECEDAANAGFQAAGRDYMDYFYIYGDMCLVDSNQVLALRKSMKNAPPGLVPTHRGDIGVCAGVLAEAYLNQGNVQKALHIEGERADWTDCNDAVAHTYNSSESALPKYSTILGQGLKAMIYNGDADSDVSFIGSLRWIGTKAGLNLPVVKPWTPWFGPDKQIAGYVEEYKGLTFKTVKGAGHLVPAIRPLHALNMLECFVFGDEQCASFTYPLNGDEVESGFLASASDAMEDSSLSSTVLGRSSTAVFVGIVGAGAIVVGVGVLAIRKRLERSLYATIPQEGRA